MLKENLRGDRIAPRIPFAAPVNAPGLRHCWTTNISVGGLGLTAYPVPTTSLQRGDDLEVEFPLGQYSRPVRAIVRIAWTGRARGDGRIGFGVQFRELS